MLDVARDLRRYHVRVCRLRTSSEGRTGSSVTRWPSRDEERGSCSCVLVMTIYTGLAMLLAKVLALATTQPVGIDALGVMGGPAWVGS